MEQPLKLYLPLTFEQVLELVRQLSVPEKQRLVEYLLEEKDPVITHLASERVLARDWLSPEEDAAWEHL